MKPWQQASVTPIATIRDTLRIIDASAMQIALVVDKDNRLLGTVTDGDIRRGILIGISLDDVVTKVMNPSPVFSTRQQSAEAIFSLMKRKKIHQIPILDDDGCLWGIEILDDLIHSSQRLNWVVLMAGGLGTRLRPLTNDVPKPMLKIGSKPVLEIIIENLIEFGFNKFFLAVNYKAETVIEHFGDGSRWQVDIQYLHETKRLGTAGALSLLSDNPVQPVLVMNGDLLTKVNFNHLIDFHVSHAVEATMCVREHDVQVPYGVVKVKDHAIESIVEKPMQRVFVNAGIYILNPSVVETIPKNAFFDMPDLFDDMIKRKKKTAAFPILEYWIDIGKIEDFRKADGEFYQIFQDKK